MSARVAPAWSRRQALKVIGAAIALPAGAFALRSFAGAPAYHSWHGQSLGAPSSLTLVHPDAGFAETTLVKMRAEVERLEQVFSLFEPESELSRLNRDGVLADPSPDLVTVIDAAQRMAETSGGAFDPSVQPLWQLYDGHFLRHPDDAVGPAGAEIDRVRALVDYRRIEVAPGRVALAPGMTLTLNAVAQGHITDRIADLLQQEGFAHAVVELGETRALGDSPEGGPWSIGLQDPANPRGVNRALAVSNEAVSVSGGYGLQFGRSALSHIFDPSTGRSPHSLLEVTVIAPRALSADALSTAIYVAGEAAAPRLLAAYPGSRAMLTRLDGSSITI